MTEHCLIPGDFFTPEQSRGSLAPWVDRLVATAGGVLLISVELAPERRNYLEVRFAVFNAKRERLFEPRCLRRRRNERKCRGGVSANKMPRVLQQKTLLKWHFAGCPLPDIFRQSKALLAQYM
jgi:hypothetical protein